MADLIAQGPNNGDRWRREVPDAASGIEIVIGRTDGDWRVPWDGQISRRHVRLLPIPGERIEISVLPSSRNPVFHRGRKAKQFTLVAGDHFAIGKTTFTLANRPGASDSPDKVKVTSHLSLIHI